MVFGNFGIGDSSNNLSSRNIVSNRITVGQTGATPILGIYSGTFTIVPNSGSSFSTVVTQNQTVDGVSVGDLIFVNMTGTEAPYVQLDRVYVSANDTISIVWRNTHNSSAATDNLSYADTNIKTITYVWFDLT